MGFVDERGMERDRERARSGVRGVRSGNMGQMSAFGGGNLVSTEVMRLKETINPAHLECNPKAARFFVIKSYSEDDVHKAIKYGVWASTDTGNRRLDTAYREMGNQGPVYLFFSVNASGQFSGMAQMESALDYTNKFGCWAQDKWSGSFMIKWTFIKDIPNNQFRHIVLANNEGKPVTNSRDTQEVMFEQVAIHTCTHTHAHARTHMHTRTHTHTHARRHTHARTHTHTSAYLSTHQYMRRRARRCSGSSTTSRARTRSSTTSASTTSGRRSSSCV